MPKIAMNAEFQDIKDIFFVGTGSFSQNDIHTGHIQDVQVSPNS